MESKRDVLGGAREFGVKRLVGEASKFDVKRLVMEAVAFFGGIGGAAE
jgi:hypothetical protein